MSLLWEIVDQVAQGPLVYEEDIRCDIAYCRFNVDGRCTNGLGYCVIEYQ